MSFCKNKCNSKPSTSSGYKPKSELALELLSRAAPMVEAHHRVNDPNTERNSGGRQIKKYNYLDWVANEIKQDRLGSVLR